MSQQSSGLRRFGEETPTYPQTRRADPPRRVCHVWASAIKNRINPERRASDLAGTHKPGRSTNGRALLLGPGAPLRCGRDDTDFSFCGSCRSPYQIRAIFSGGTYIASPGLTPNAFWNSTMFCTAPLVR